MPVYVKNIRYLQKTQSGYVLETPITSQNLSQLEGDIMDFLNRNGYTASTKVTKTGLEISNIRDLRTGKRAGSDKYAKLRSLIATSLEQKNMVGEVTGGN